MNTLSRTAAAVSLLLAVLFDPRAYAEQAQFGVRVDNVRPGQGTVRVAIYAEAQWLTEPLSVGEVRARDGSVRLEFSAPAQRRVALAAYQDLNGDGRLNRNIIGLPTEPYAFSNNAPARFGAPSFADAAIDPLAGSEAVMTLR